MAIAIATLAVAVAGSAPPPKPAPPAPAGAGGLTLQRFNNTAVTGVPYRTVRTADLDAIATCSLNCGGAESLLLSGRLRPEAGGRYGFELTFDPVLDFPSTKVCPLSASHQYTRPRPIHIHIYNIYIHGYLYNINIMHKHIYT